MPASNDTWSGIEDSIGGAGDGDGTRNGSPCYGPRLRQVANGINHIVGVGRVVFSQAISDFADSPDVAPSPSTVWRFRYRHAFTNGQNLGAIVTFVPVDTGTATTADPDVQLVEEGGPSTWRLALTNAHEAAPSYPEDLMVASDAGDIDLVNPPAGPSLMDNALHSWRIQVNRGFRITSAFIFERKSADWPEGSPFLSGTDVFVEPGAFDPGAMIQSDGAVTDNLVRSRTAQEHIFHFERDTPGFSQPLSGAALNSLTGANAAPVVNIVDGSLAWAANTWGIPVPSLSGGYGYRQVVEAWVHVYAENVGSVDGALQAESSLGTVGFPALGAAQWRISNSKILLSTTADDRVDIQAHRGTGASWIVHAAFVEINPD